MTSLKRLFEFIKYKAALIICTGINMLINITSIVLILTLTNHSSGISFWSSSPTSDDQPDEGEHYKKIPPKSCPHFHVKKVHEKFQSNMEDVWVVSHITPRGKSQYVDGSPACGLYNFVPGECKCLRYSLSVNEEENSLTRKTVGLEVKSQNFRYIESRLVYVEDYHDVFQTQFSMAAQISFDSTKSKLTASPIDEEIYPEYQAFALLGTDNYETYAVYVSCTPFSAGPHAWVAFSTAAFSKENVEKTQLKIQNILSKNGIDFKNMMEIDQDHCRP